MFFSVKSFLKYKYISLTRLAFKKNDDVQGLILYGLIDVITSSSDESSNSEKTDGLLIRTGVNEKDVDDGEALIFSMVSLTIVDGFCCFRCRLLVIFFNFLVPVLMSISKLPGLSWFWVKSNCMLGAILFKTEKGQQ